MLTNDQVTYIRQVLKNRGIETLDLLDEMTDHFVLAVEKRWEQEPQLALRYALTKEIATFGPHGMQTLQRDYEIRLEKSGRKLLLETFLHLWKLPQIIASISVYALIYYSVLHFSNAPELLYYILSALFFAACLYILYFTKVSNRLKLAQFQRLQKGAWLPISLGGIFMVNFPTSIHNLENIGMYTLLGGSYFLFLCVAIQMTYKGMTLYKTKQKEYATA